MTILDLLQKYELFQYKMNSSQPTYRFPIMKDVAYMYKCRSLIIMVDLSNPINVNALHRSDPFIPHFLSLFILKEGHYQFNKTSAFLLIMLCKVLVC